MQLQGVVLFVEADFTQSARHVMFDRNAGYGTGDGLGISLHGVDSRRACTRFASFTGNRWGWIMIQYAIGFEFRFQQFLEIAGKPFLAAGIFVVKRCRFHCASGYGWLIKRRFSDRPLGLLGGGLTDGRLLND